MKQRITFAVAALLLCPGMVHAMFMQPHPIPLERVAKNTQAYIEQHPEEAEGYYTLGRIYYLGFINRALFVPGFDEGSEEQSARIAPDWMIGNYQGQMIRAEAERRALKELELTEKPNYSTEIGKTYFAKVEVYNQQLRQEGWKPAPVTSDEALAYAAKAKQHLQKAIEMDEKNALYTLGLASLYEQTLEFLSTNKLESSEFAAVDKTLILDTYWHAFDLALEKDAKLERRPVAGLPSLVSYEAGKAWLRLGGSDEKMAEAIEQQLDKLGNLRMGAITPLVITAPEVARPAELVLENKRITFDLDGEGHREAWDWITPATGLLVWDPMDQRTITSGRQLFGSYTFQIIWRDGFRALAALDDDLNEVIDGGELIGLSVWYDRNSNGISEQSEVFSIESLGIVSLAYDHTETCEGTLVRKFGVSYANGSSGHIWDWISYTSE